MKRKPIVILRMTFIIVFILCLSCTKGDESTSIDDSSDYQCGTYNGHVLWTGPKGGCYYYNSNNNKTYVDRSYCNCN